MEAVVTWLKGLAAAAEAVPGFLMGVLTEIRQGTAQLLGLASENLLVVAIIVAIAGVMLLRPPHAPR